MSLGMRKLATYLAVLASMGNATPAPRRKPPKRYSITRLQGPDYSDVPPVLARGKRRTLALKLAQVVNWHDERANLYGCHPCPKCGEVKHRCAFKRPHGLIIECAACGDCRPVRAWID